MNTYERKKYTFDDLVGILDDEVTVAFEDVLASFDDDSTEDEWVTVDTAHDLVKKAIKELAPLWKIIYKI